MGVSKSGVAGAINVGRFPLLTCENGFVNVNAGGSMRCLSGSPATLPVTAIQEVLSICARSNDNCDVHINVIQY